MQSTGVTIGIPLYNEERYIEESLRSAVSQCDVVLISDNDSTDHSLLICEAIGKEFSHIHLTRQPRNIGAIANFKYLLDKANTEFFMWLGAHDALPQGYVRHLTTLLKYQPDAVLAYGASHHISIEGNPTGKYDYSYHADISNPSPVVRLMGLIRRLHDCSLVHGVFRTEQLRLAWDECAIDTFIGADHILLSYAAIHGPFLYAPQTHLIRRDAHPMDSQENQLKRMGLKQPDPSHLTHHELQHRQYSLAARISTGSGVRGLLFRIRVRYYLIARFGPFSYSIADRVYDTVLTKLIQCSSAIPRVTRNMCGFFRRAMVRLIRVIS
jgi:glycosyltransferase involved in cell wall biosynthesis